MRERQSGEYRDEFRRFKKLTKWPGRAVYTFDDECGLLALRSHSQRQAPWREQEQRVEIGPAPGWVTGIERGATEKWEKIKTDLLELSWSGDKEEIGMNRGGGEGE